MPHYTHFHRPPSSALSSLPSPPGLNRLLNLLPVPPACTARLYRPPVPPRSVIKFDRNSCVLVNPKGLPIGTRVLGFVTHELRARQMMKVGRGCGWW